MIERMCKDKAQPTLIAAAVRIVRAIAAIASEANEQEFEMTEEDLAAVQKKIKKGADVDAAVAKVKKKKA